MEGFQPHPIPQNVTSFEFRLVGDMTLKQFGYLASGLGVAYLVFIFLSTNVPFFAYPIILISALSGVLLAFVPIQNRPLDHWLKAFLIAILKPTQRKYRSENLNIENANFLNRLNLYLQSINPQPVVQVVAPMLQVNVPRSAALTPIKPVIDKTRKEEGLPTSEELKETVELAKKAEHIQTQILSTQQQLEMIKKSASIPGSDPRVFAKQFQEVLNELQLLNAAATEISHNLAILSNSPMVPRIQSKVVAPIKAKSSPTVSLTSTANIINGIVTDSQGNYIEGAVVVAHDKQDLPVRALRSNKLGQFIAATPLPSGTYTLNTERDNLLFDVIEVELVGDVLKPIMIQAKRGGAGGG